MSIQPSVMEPLDLDVESEDEDGTMQARGEAASKAIRRNFPKLSKAVTRGDIPEELYAQELIGQPMLDIFVNQSFTDQDKGRKIMLEVQKAVEIQPDLFDAFCSILCDETVTKDLAQRLRGWCACTKKKTRTFHCWSNIPPDLVISTASELSRQ